MKLLAIFILHKEDGKKVKILQNEFQLDHLSYFQRSSARQFLVLSARTGVDYTGLNVKRSVNIEENINTTMHVYVRSDGLASVVISNTDYPKQAAHIVLSKAMDEFTNVYPPNTWEKVTEGSGKMVSLNEMLVKYQDPHNADALMRLQRDIDETKDILMTSLENILKRGEKLDDIVARSEDLSAHAKGFYRTAKKTNQCCSLY